MIVIGVEWFKFGENHNFVDQNRKWSFGNSYGAVLF